MRHVLRIVTELRRVVMVVVASDGFKDLAIQVRKIESEEKASQHDEPPESGLKILGE